MDGVVAPELAAAAIAALEHRGSAAAGPPSNAASGTAAEITAALTGDGSHASSGVVQTGDTGAGRLRLPDALQRAQAARGLVSFAASWSVGSLFPTINASWVAASSTVAVLVPLYAAVRVIYAALSAPVITVSFAMSYRACWEGVWPLRAEALAPAYLPLAGCAALCGLYLWAALRRAGSAWASGPLILSIFLGVLVYWSLSAWVVGVPLPPGSHLEAGSVLLGGPARASGRAPDMWELGDSTVEPLAEWSWLASSTALDQAVEVNESASDGSGVVTESPASSVVRLAPGRAKSLLKVELLETGRWKALEAVHVSVPVWSSPLLLAVCLGLGPLLSLLRVLLAKSTRLEHGWRLQRAVVQLGRYIEACGTAVTTVLALLVVAVAGDAIMLSALLEYNGIRHLLELLQAAIRSYTQAGSGTGGGTMGLDELQSSVDGALAGHQGFTQAGAGSLPEESGLDGHLWVLGEPNFFLVVPNGTAAGDRAGGGAGQLQGSAMATIVLYYIPVLFLLWLGVRVWLHHRAEAAIVARRPAALAEHVSAEGDRRAGRKALPPLVAYLSVYAILLAWYLSVALPAVPESVWDVARRRPVGWVGAATSPLLMLTAAALAILSHRTVRNVGRLALLFDEDMAGGRDDDLSAARRPKTD